MVTSSTRYKIQLKQFPNSEWSDTSQDNWFLNKEAAKKAVKTILINGFARDARIVKIIMTTELIT